MALLTNINGKFSVSDAGAVTFNNAFTFPTADGAANYVLQTNGSGQLAWALNGNGDISGSGTANKVTKFTGAKVIGDGPITFSGNNSTFAGIVTANGFRTTSGSTDYSLLTRNSSNTAVYIQQAGSGNILDVRYGSQAAGQGTSAFAVNSSGNSTFAGDVISSGTSKSLKYWRRLWADANNDWGLNNNAGTGVISVSGMGTPSTSTTTFAGTVQTTQITATNGLNYLKRNTDASLQLRSENTRSGLFITKPATDTVMGSALVLADESYRLGTANYYHMVMLQNGNTYFNQNVGIGTTSPSVKLQVDGGDLRVRDSGNVALQIVSSDSGQSAIQFGDDGDINDGRIVYMNATDLMRFFTNDSERMVIDSSGNVGIGTSSPSKLLTLNDASGAALQWQYNGGNYLRIEADSGGGSYYAAAGLYHRFFTSGSERMRIDSSGNVTLGNSTYGSSLGQLRIINDAASNPASLSLFGYNNVADGGNYASIDLAMQSSGTGGNVVASIRGLAEGTGENASDLAFYTATGGTLSERMRIDSSGNVGIGTEGTNIVVTGKGLGIQNIGQDTTASMRLTGANATGNPGVATYTELKHYGEYLRFGINHNGGTDVITINSSKNVGIGTDSPASKFEVYGGTSGVNDVDRYIRFKASNGEKRFDFYVGGTGNASSLGMYTSDGTTKNVQISAGGTSYLNAGNVGIGTTSPTYKLHVVSSNNVSIFEDTSGANGASFLVFNVPGAFAIGSIGRNGSANSVSYNTGSDYRLKEDLKDFNALDLVNNITAYDYKWKNTEQRDYGFVAHELEKTLPNVVTGEKDDEKMQSVDYSKLTPILLKAIQEQQEIINDLKSRIEQLEN